jgi:hypothetical protein
LQKSGSYQNTSNGCSYVIEDQNLTYAPYTIKPKDENNSLVDGIRIGPGELTPLLPSQ